MRYIWGLWCVAMGLASCAAEQTSSDAVLAEVGERVITVADLETFVAKLPAHLRAEEEDLSSYRDYLQNLVDRELILREAGKRGLDTLAALRFALDDETNMRLAREVGRELVDAGIRIDEEELRAAYEEYDLGWEVWPAHILSATEEDARAVIAEVEKGRDFSELARERSLADDADKGGNLGAFFDQGDAVPALREGTFHLQEGEISQPIKTKDGYEVVKILQKRRRPFEQLRDDIARQMARRKWAERRAAVVDSLGGLYHIRYHRARVRAVLRGLFEAELSAGEAMAPLIEYEGGRILVGDAVRGLRRIKKGALPPDSAAVFAEIERWILPDSLMALKARREGRAHRADVLAWRDKRRKALLASQLRREVVAGKVEIDDEEVRAFYARHLDSYRKLPGVIRMTEVLVGTRAEAEELLARARQGERLEELAARYSLRPQLQPVGGHSFADSGRVEIASLYQSPYREFFGDSNSEAVGLLQGPLEVQGYYSIFRLDEPIEKEPIPFRQVRRPIRAKLREAGEARLFDAFLDSLRTARAGQVRWHEDVLERYVRARRDS